MYYLNVSDHHAALARAALNGNRKLRLVSCTPSSKAQAISIRFVATAGATQLNLVIKQKPAEGSAA